jgi:hypothetical protein
MGHRVDGRRGDKGPSATRATMRNSALSESDVMARRTIPLLACRKQWVKHCGINRLHGCYTLRCRYSIKAIHYESRECEKSPRQ